VDAEEQTHGIASITSESSETSSSMTSPELSRRAGALLILITTFAPATRSPEEPCVSLDKARLPFSVSFAANSVDTPLLCSLTGDLFKTNPTRLALQEALTMLIDVWTSTMDPEAYTLLALAWDRLDAAIIAGDYREQRSAARKLQRLYGQSASEFYIGSRITDGHCRLRALGRHPVPDDRFAPCPKHPHLREWSGNRCSACIGQLPIPQGFDADWAPITQALKEVTA